MQAITGKIKSIFTLLLLLGAAFNISAQNLVVSSVSGNTSEDATNATFTIGLDAPAIADISVSIVSQNTSEVIVSPASINFASGTSAAQTITLTGVNDTFVDGDQMVIIDITPSVGSPTTIEVTNEDNDSSTLSVSATVQAAEDATDGLFTITSTRAISTATTITLTTTGTATSGTDYTAIPATVVLPANQTTVTVPVEVITDALIEDDETVILTLISTNNADVVVGATDEATITITDNDVATLSIAATTQAAEDDTDGLFTITSTQAVPTATTITLTATGTATSGTDYTAIPATVVLPANQTTVTVPVEVITDALIEDDETVILTLISTNNADVVVGATDEATITITDNDVATLSIAATTQAAEDDTDGLFTITSTQAVPTATTITLTATGTATSGTDYTAIPATVVLPANQTTVTVPVEVITDALIEDDETVILTLISTNNADVVVGATDEATITITDNDVATLSIAATTQAAEDDTDGLFTITSTQAVPTATTITLTATGTATSGTDYTAIPATVVLPANQTTVTVPVEVITDALIEDDETVILTLISTNNADVVVGATDEATITITDNDVATLSIAATTQATEDDTDGLFTISSSQAVPTATTITLTATGTATSGTDYTAIPATVVLPANQTTVTVPVEVITDALIEDDETVILTLISTNNADVVVGATDEATITITDNDVATLSIAATTQAAEDDTDGLFTITSTQAVPTATTITLTTTGTATSGTDYTAIPATVVLPANQTTVTVPVEVITDALIEDDETVILTLVSTNNADVVVGVTDEATIIITDNDVATLSIATTTQAAEDATDGLFTITSTQAVPTATTITLTTTGTASSGTDYTAIPATVVLPANQTSATIPVEVITDALIEDDETVILTLVSTNNPDVVVGTTDEATIIITDNDVATLSIAATTQAAEDATDGLFTITSTQAVPTATTITLTTTGTATSGTDYTAIPATVVLPANQTSATIPVEVITDALIEDDETVILTLVSTNNPDVVVGATDEATITITDNDVADFTINPSPLGVTEGGTATFNVVLIAQPASNVVISVSSGDTGAATVSNPTLTFGAGNWNVAQVVTVTGVQDADLTNESVSVTLSVVNGSSDNNFHNLSKTLTVNITDDESANYVLSTNSLIIDEESTGTFTVVLSAQPTNPVTINLESDDTGAASVSPGSLTFNNSNWNVSQIVTITGEQDNDLVNESVFITASVTADSDDAFASLGDQTVQVTVNDDDIADYTITPSPLSVTEGSTATFSVVLSAQPASNVVISLGSNDINAATVSAATLTFSSENWNVAQVITVSGVQDDDLIDETVTITANVINANSDNNFDDLSKILTVNVTDDDSGDLSMTPSPVIVTEGLTATFSVVLSAQPASNVVISLSSNNTDAATVSDATLTFNSGNWNIAQIVTVTGVQDVDLNNETVTITASVVNANSDNNFDGLRKTLTVNVTDDDIADLKMTPSPVTVSEGSTSTFSVVLTVQPASNVVIGLSSDDTGAATLSNNTLTFSTSNWNVAQIVTATGVQDDDPNDESVTITASSVDESSDDNFDGLTKTLTVNVTDDDSAPVFTSTPITLINEDELYSYTIITTDEDGDIPVLTSIQMPSWLSFTDNGDGTGLLTGTPTNNDVTETPQQVVIRATDPLFTVDHQFSITVINTNDAPLFSTSGITVATEDSPYLYNIQVEDDDGNNVTISAPTLPAWLTFTNLNNGQARLSGTPLNNDVGIHAVSLRAHDGTIATFQNFDITVSNTNDAPVITSTHVTNAIEDSEYTYNITTRDDDGDVVSINASTLPTWLELTDNKDGTALLRGIPTDKDIITTPILLRINDAIETRYIGFEIEIANINDVPRIINSSFSTQENKNLIISITDIAKDDDNNIPNITTSDLDFNSIEPGTTDPNHGSITFNTQDTIINYTPDSGFSGSDSFSVKIKDISGAISNEGTISIRVSNEAPDAVDDAFTIDEDTPTYLNVLANDTDLQNNIVASKDTVITDPLNGTAVAQNDGRILYSPNANFNGTDNFTYRIEDADGYFDQATVNITINAVNDAPSLQDDNATTSEDNPVTIDVLDNDSDIDNAIAPSTLRIVDQAGNGSLTVNSGTNDITYTPETDFNGTDVFTYSVEDESGAMSEATVTVNVTPVNDQPTPLDDYIQTTEDTPVLIRLLDNDMDLENNIDSCTVSILKQPGSGAVSKVGCGRVRYTPNSNFNGDDSFTYQVCDSLGACGVATVYITVNEVNDPPVAVADSYETDEDTPITMNVLDNDKDPDTNDDFDTAILSIHTQASNGTLTIINKEIQYTPHPDFNGNDSFEYQICDATELCAIGTVSINVIAVNDVPVAEDDYDSGMINTSIRTYILENDVDVDNNLNLNSITIVTEPQNGIAVLEEGTGYIVYTPAVEFSGQDQYTYRICDDEGACDEATVYLTVTSTNSRPESNSDYVETDEDELVNISPLANDTDPDNDLDVSSLAVVQPPEYGTYNLDIENSIIEYTPDENYFGNDTIIYQICDLGTPQYCVLDTIAIKVISINDAPIATDDYLTVVEGQSAELDLTLNDDDIETPELLTIRISDNTPATKGTAQILPDKKTLRYSAAFNCGCVEEVVNYILEDGTGAISGARVTIRIEKAPDNLPEVFTPNGDGVNDYFVIPGIETEEYRNNELYIFNRWGAQVYYMKDYDNTWDGKSSASTLGSAELAEGTYFYVFKMDDGRVIKGTVYLKK